MADSRGNPPADQGRPIDTAQPNTLGGANWNVGLPGDVSTISQSGEKPSSDGRDLLGRQWVVGPSEQSTTDQLVNLADPQLKHLDQDRLDALDDSQLLVIENWLLALRQSFDIHKVLVPQHKLSSVPIERSTERNLETSDRYFFHAKLEGEPNPSLVYFLEAIIFVFQLAKTVAKRTEKYDQFKQFYSDFANTDLERWLDDVAPNPIRDGNIEEPFDQVAIQKVIDVVEESLRVLQELISLKANIADVDVTVGATGDSGEKAVADAVATDFIGSAGDATAVGATATGEGGDATKDQTQQQTDEQRADQTTASVPRIKLTAPPDVLKVVVTKEFVGKSRALIGDASTRRQFTNESAWVMQGVLAQLYPDYIGRMNELPPEVLSAVSDAVIARVADLHTSGDLGGITGRIRAIQSAAKDAMRNSLVLEQQAQQAGRGDYPIAAQATESTSVDGTTSTMPTRGDLIQNNLPDVVSYLASTLRENGQTVLAQPDLEKLAFEQLSLLDTNELIAITSGIPLSRKKTFERMANSVGTAVAREGVAQLAVTEQALGRLNLFIADGLDQGKTPEQILAEIEALPAEALQALTGLETTPDTLVAVRSLVVEKTIQQCHVVFSIQSIGARQAISSEMAVKSAATFLTATGSKKGQEEKETTLTYQTAKSAQKRVRGFLEYYLATWNAVPMEKKVALYLIKNPTVRGDQVEAHAINMPLDIMESLDLLNSKELNTLAADYALHREEYKKYPVGERNEKIGQIFGELPADSDYRQFFQQIYALEHLERLERFNALSKDAQEKFAQMYGYASAAALYAAFMATYDESQTGTVNNAIVLTAVVMVAGPEGGEEIPQTIYPNVIDPLSDEGLTEDLLEAVDDDEVGAAFGNAGHTPASVAGTTPPRAMPRKIRNAKKMVKGAFSKAKGAAKKKLGKTVATKALTEGTKQLIGKGLAGATAGLSYVATNKNLRKIIGGALLAGTTFILSKAGTLASMVGGGIGATLGWISGGPLGAATGGFVGTLAGSMAPEAWWNPRIFNANQYPWAGTNPYEPSMSQIRGAQGSPTATSATTAGGATGSGDGSGGTSSGSAVLSSSPTPATLAAGAVVTAKAVGMAVIATAGFPAMAIGSIAALTMVVMLVIWGAFLIPTPSVPNPKSTDEGIEENPYISIRKIATPQRLENNQGATIQYTILVEPKLGYAVAINSVTDEFFEYGENSPEDGSSSLISPLATDAFGTEIITTTVTRQYTIDIPANTYVDAYITNRVSFDFNVYDALNPETLIMSNEEAGASAYVIIGNPKVGCWPANGVITQLEVGYPNSGASHTPYNSDAIDIAAPGQDNNIYSPFGGLACGRVSKSGSQYTGYGIHVELFFEYNKKPLVLVFAHLHQFNDLSNGECKPVGPGSILGEMGSTGNSSGVHLHYELKRNTYNVKLRDLIMGGENIHKDQRVRSCFSPE